ncbi:MAG: thioredoxin [Candidatus Marinimicrobia bacterium CG_4_9_14_3_um_filter_48_9]|nr:MAG: thioredoxin [Candidatus Marinimicrobia bacterium CG_4_9_14_3_um_filter_48_9]
MQFAEFQNQLQHTELALIYCSTPTCNVCKVLRPKVELMVSEIGDWEFIYIDTTQNPEIAGQYLIFSVPTLLLFAQGKEVQRFSRHFGLDDLKLELERYQKLTRSAK